MFSMLQLLLPAAVVMWRHACSVGQWCAVLFFYLLFFFIFFFKQQCDNDFELFFSSSILKDLSISRVLSIVPMSLLQNTRQHPGRRVSILECLHLLPFGDAVPGGSTRPTQHGDGSFRKITLLHRDTTIHNIGRHLKNQRRTAEGQMHAPGQINAQTRSQFLPTCSQENSAENVMLAGCVRIKLAQNANVCLKRSLSSIPADQIGKVIRKGKRED